jgi:hypothetical protein
MNGFARAAQKRGKGQGARDPACATVGPSGEVAPPAPCPLPRFFNPTAYRYRPVSIRKTSPAPCP